MYTGHTCGRAKAGFNDMVTAYQHFYLAELNSFFDCIRLQIVLAVITGHLLNLKSLHT